MTWLLEKGTFSCLTPTSGAHDVCNGSCTKVGNLLKNSCRFMVHVKKVVGLWVLYQNNCSFVNFTLRLLNNFLTYMLVVVISLGSKLSFMQRGKIQSLFWFQAWFTVATSQTIVSGPQLRYHLVVILALFSKAPAPENLGFLGATPI